MAQLTKQENRISADENEVAMYAIRTNVPPAPPISNSAALQPTLDPSEAIHTAVHSTDKYPLTSIEVTEGQGSAEYDTTTSTTASALDALDELMKITSNAELQPSSTRPPLPNIPTQESSNSPPGSVELTGVSAAPSPPITDERPPWETQTYTKTASEANSASITPASGSSPQKFHTSQNISENSPNEDASSLLEKLSIEQPSKAPVSKSPLTAGESERTEPAPHDVEG